MKHSHDDMVNQRLVVIQIEQDNTMNFKLTCAVSFISTIIKSLRSKSHRMSKKKHLFVIEDEPIIREALKELLSQTYSVITATSCSDAIQTYKHLYDTIHLITLDIGLPDGTAVDLFNALEKISFPYMPPVIVISAFNTYDDINKTLTQFNAFAHITKPYDNNTLLTTISHALTQHVTQRGFEETVRDSELDKLLSQRSLKIQTDFLNYNQGRFYANNSLSIDVFNITHDNTHRKNTPMELIISEFEKDCGYTAPKPPIPTILIIEDEAILREAHQLLLTTQGFNVVVAGCGETAKEILHSRQDIDIVTLDLNLPDMNGTDLIPLIKGAINHNNQPPDIIAITAYDDKDTLEAVIPKGVYRYLSKKNLDNNTILSLINDINLNRFGMRILPQLLKKIKHQQPSYRIRKMMLNDQLKTSDSISGKDLLDLFPDFTPNTISDTDYFDTTSINEGLEQMKNSFFEKNPSERIYN